MSCRLYSPATLIAIDTNEDRLALAREKGLADVTLNPLTCDIEAEVKALTEGRGADTVLEVAGARNTFELAWRIARPNAVVCVVALYDQPQVIPLPDMYGKNLIFKTGGVDGNKCEEILKLIKAGRLDPSFLITHRYPLKDAMAAYELFEKKEDGVIKVALVP